MNPTVISVPFSIGDKVYIIQEAKMKKPKRVAYNVQEGRNGLLFDYSHCPECNNVVLVDTSQVKDDKC